MKKNIMVMIAFLAAPSLMARGGGDAFVGGLAGGTFGGLLGGAVARSSAPETVVVHNSDDGRGREALRAVDRLEDAVRKDLRTLKDKIDRNHDAIEKIDRNFEEVKLNTSDIVKLKEESSDIKQKYDALDKRIQLLEQRIGVLERK